MSRARRQGSVAIFFAALQLASSFALMANLVLCQTAAGHVEIESAFSGDCCVEHLVPAGLRARQAERGCDCIDTPLFQTAIDARTKVERPLPVSPPFLLALLPVRVDLHPWAASRRRPTAGGRAGESIAVIRSVVLLV